MTTKASATTSNFATLAATTGTFMAREMVPMQIRNVRLNKPSPADTLWLRDTLDRASAHYGSHIELTKDGSLATRWARRGSLRR